MGPVGYLVRRGRRGPTASAAATGAATPRPPLDVEAPPPDPETIPYLERRIVVVIDPSKWR
jgi:hypothetical protein